MGIKGQRTDPYYWSKRTSYLKNKEASLLRQRHSLLAGNFKNLSKRTYPGICEMCGVSANGEMWALVYHHWDDATPSAGVWVCQLCHRVVEAVEIIDGGPTTRDTYNHVSIPAICTKYREMKVQIMNDYARTRLL